MDNKKPLSERINKLTGIDTSKTLAERLAKRETKNKPKPTHP